jgi:lipopolysaccharide/colanic/teichoic acid biosynthesis glycosyltransferase
MTRGTGVLFRRERVGLGGRRFQTLQFRSLNPSSDVESQVRWTIAQDPRCVTGWAAVDNLRGDTSTVDRVQFDNAYIQTWSLRLDIKVLVRTIGAVLGRTGG